MKQSSNQGIPARGFWKNGHRYFHFTPDRLTVADFSAPIPTVQFMQPGNINVPEEGWEKITIKEFNELIDAI